MASAHHHGAEGQAPTFHGEAAMVVRHHILDVYGTHLHLATTRRDWATLRRKYPKAPRIGDEWGSMNQWVERSTKAMAHDHIALFVDVPAHHGDDAALIDTIAHEAAHGACRILDDAGATYDADSEPLAWLVGWLTRWVWEAT